MKKKKKFAGGGRGWWSAKFWRSYSKVQTTIRDPGLLLYTARRKSVFRFGSSTFATVAVLQELDCHVDASILSGDASGAGGGPGEGRG